MPEYSDHIDCYAGWTEFVPYYLGRSDAVDKAAQSFMDSIQATTSPTETNIGILRASNAAAICSIRGVLASGGHKPCKGDVLLAIQMLYMVEVYIALRVWAYLTLSPYTAYRLSCD
jgi:hypothetical protein